MGYIRHQFCYILKFMEQRITLQLISRVVHNIPHWRALLILLECHEKILFHKEDLAPLHVDTSRMERYLHCRRCIA